MPRPDNPTLTGEDWGKYKVYLEVEYDAKEWNSRHWLCPVCKTRNSVMHNVCDCSRERVKKTIGHSRYGNPVERWVMLVEPL